jgi:hypothetical protein
MGGRGTGWGIAAVVALAAIDLTGAWLAKEFSARPRPVVLGAGLASFLVLFAVYVVSLRYLDLWAATFGWVVALEIGVLLLDRLRFATPIPTHKLVLAGLIVVLQVALMLPGDTTHHDSVVEGHAAAAGSQR